MASFVPMKIRHVWFLVEEIFTRGNRDMGPILSPRKVTNLWRGNRWPGGCGEKKLYVSDVICHAFDIEIIALPEKKLIKNKF